MSQNYLAKHWKKLATIRIWLMIYSIASSPISITPLSLTPSTFCSTKKNIFVGPFVFQGLEQDKPDKTFKFLPLR
jgi:hypothetical protein